MLAEVAARLGRFEDSETLLRRCLELAPGFTAARHYYALVLHRQSKSEAALAEIDRLLEAEPDNPSYRFLKATAEGNLHALADERAAKAVLAARTGIADPTILAISYDDFRALAPPDLEPTRAAVEGVLRQFPAADRNVDDHVDASILDDLRRDGFSKTLRS